MKKTLFVAVLLSYALGSVAETTYTTTQLENLNRESYISTVGVHDPSIVYDAANNNYHIWGSHRGYGTSTDLMNWKTSWGWITDNSFQGLEGYGGSNPSGNFTNAFKYQQVTKVKNYNGEMVDFPNFDAEAYCNRYAADKSTWLGGNMWAPDLVWNETMKKWCMYMSLNGDKWNSIIVLLTSDKVEGPFVYQAPVVMGGFNGQTYGGVSAPKISETDFTIATGLTTLPGRYKTSSNGTYWPNCIDPCAFFDETGELWLVYGSWSGGIFQLKLDKETGLRDYTYKYKYQVNGSTSTATGTPSANCTSDPYFGKKIAGGYYSSGEGPYIQHIGDYYYLFMSYGGFAPLEGYEMRIFRSSTPDGDYVDAYGNSAIFKSYKLNYGPKATSNIGMRLMSAYNNWGPLQKMGWCSQGHNSAIVDKYGRAFVVYHTKFNDGTAGHLVHMNQLFVNESGWLVAAPFAFHGETVKDSDIKSKEMWTKAQVAGDYQILLHEYKLPSDNSEWIANRKPLRITLNEDGSVSGDMSGSWTIPAGTSYINVTLGNFTYQGVLVENTISGDARGVSGVAAVFNGWTDNKNKALCFTCVDSNKDANSGVALWGYKLQESSALAYAYKMITTNNPLPTKLNENIDLYGMYDLTDGVKIQWSSNRPEYMSNRGLFKAPDAATSIRLSYTLTCGNSKANSSKSYSAGNVSKGVASGDYKTGLVGYYDMNAMPITNWVDGSQTTATGKYGTGAEPTLEADSARAGKVLRQHFGAQADVSYTRMENPLKGESNLEGATITMWVKRLDGNVWDAIWSFFNSTESAAAGERLFLTGNSYLGYNDNAGNWFDLNHPNTTCNYIPVGKWARVTWTFSAQGTKLYIDGELKDNKTYSGSTTVDAFDYNRVLKFISSANYFNLGIGSFWGSSPIMIDDVMIFNREISGTDLAGMTLMQNRDFNFASGEYSTSVKEVKEATDELENGEDGKFLKDGKIVIIKDGKAYSITGTEL